jgi:hypothetical protein
MHCLSRAKRASLSTFSYDGVAKILTPRAAKPACWIALPKLSMVAGIKIIRRELGQGGRPSHHPWQKKRDLRENNNQGNGDHQGDPERRNSGINLIEGYVGKTAHDETQ